MFCHNPGCVGHYDFDKIAYFAKKRFVDGQPTIELMQQATSDRERQEIALVAMMDLEEDTIKDLSLNCIHADECKLNNCRGLLKHLIEEDIASY